MDEVRNAVRLRAAQTSMRRTARAVGVAYGTLKSFVEGSEPYTSTYNRLVLWYAAWDARTDGRLSFGRAAAMLAALTGHMPEPTRAQCEMLLVQVIREWTHGAGVPPPVWLAEMEQGEDDEGERG